MFGPWVCVCVCVERGCRCLYDPYSGKQHLNFFNFTYFTNTGFFTTWDHAKAQESGWERESIIIIWTNPRKCYRIRCVAIVMIYLHTTRCFGAYSLSSPHGVAILFLLHTHTLVFYYYYGVLWCHFALHMHEYSRLRGTHPFQLPAISRLEMVLFLFSHPTNSYFIQLFPLPGSFAGSCRHPTELTRAPSAHTNPSHTVKLYKCSQINANTNDIESTWNRLGISKL